MDRSMRARYQKARAESARSGQRYFENEREMLYRSGAVRLPEREKREAVTLTDMCYVWLRDGRRLPYKSRLSAYRAFKSKGFRMRDKDGSEWVYNCELVARTIGGGERRMYFADVTRLDDAKRLLRRQPRTESTVETGDHFVYAVALW